MVHMVKQVNPQMQILFVTQALKNAQQEVVRVAGAERIINNAHDLDDEVDYKPKVTMNLIY